MNTIKIWEDNPSEKQIDEIVSHLQEGKLALIPTDSVYAIVCDALNQKAINRLCDIKNINPDKNTLTILCNDISMASEYSSFNNDGFKLLKKYTPGPFTFLFKASRNLPKSFKERREVGIRIPDLITPRKIVERLGHPLMSTSISFENEDYARNFDLITEKYRKTVDIFVEGSEGSTQFTTVIDAIDGKCEIIREGLGQL